MPDQSEAPIVQRLMTMFSHRGDGIPTQFVNPDGPEAAEIIRLCEEALRADRQRWQEIYEDECMAFGIRNYAMSSVERLTAVIAEIEGSNL